MHTEPKVEYRAAQPTVGIRTQVTMRRMPQVIPQLTGEVFAWLAAREIAPAGPPFVRFHVIDMAARMDIEIGVPVAAPVAGDDRATAGELPAGRYAALVYTGVRNGIAANKALLDWGAARGLAWDRRDTPQGDAFAGRYESSLTDPATEPDMARWETEVAIRLADG
jgi:effector-binding domain-containing protein